MVPLENSYRKKHQSKNFIALKSVLMAFRNFELFSGGSPILTARTDPSFYQIGKLMGNIIGSSFSAKIFREGRNRAKEIVK